VLNSLSIAADPESLYNLIYGGKGRMPGFGVDCAPRGQCTFGARLSDEEVADMAAYVLERAAAGWTQPPQP
jgi:cytochrome c6